MTTNFRLPRVLRNVSLAGLGGCILRLALYRVGFDEKNLLPRFHPLHAACLLLTAAVILYSICSVRKYSPEAAGAGQNPLLRGVRCLAGAALVLHGLTLVPQLPNLLCIGRLVLSFSSALAMVLLAARVCKGRTAQLICHCPVCIFFLAEMICRYQHWSGNPQLPDYGFHVLACAALVLGSYYRLAFFAGLGKPCLHSFFSLVGCFLCLLCLSGPEHWSFYLAGALWAGAGMFTMQLPEEPRETQEALYPTDE